VINKTEIKRAMKL